MTPLGRAIAALWAVWLALAPLPASAHALLLRSDPAAGVVGPADRPPERLSLWFSEPVDVDFNAVAVVDAQGRRVDHLDAHVAADDPHRVEVSLAKVEQGAYAVRWRVTSTDNHLVGGTFWFGVGFATTLPPSALTDTSAPPVRWLEVVARWIALAATLVLAGAAFFDVLVRRPLALAVPTQTRPILIAGSAFVMAQLLWAAAQAEAVAELPLPRALDANVLRSVFLDSRFATLWWLRLVIGVALAVGLYTRARPRLAALLGIGLVVATALSGHASGARLLTPVAEFVDTAHLLAASVWLGGLAQLLLVLVALRQASAADRSSILRPLVPRVSGIAVVSVVVLVATGTFSAWEQAGGLDAIVSTAYGQGLLAKLALVVPLVALGAINLLIVRPRLGANPPNGRRERTLRAFRSVVAGELALGTGVLAATSLLSSLPPPGAQGLPGPIETARQAGDLRVQLTVDPNWVGESRFRVLLSDGRGEPPADVRNVILTFTMEGMNMGRTTVPASPVEAGVFQAEGFYVGMPGISQIGVAIARDAGDQSAVFSVETPGVSEQQFRGLAPVLGLVPRGSTPVSGDGRPERGAAIYAQSCALCHGDTGIGNGPAAASLIPPPADLTLHARWHSDEQLFWFITHGVAGTPMPSFADQLTSTDRWDVIAHLHALAEAPTATPPREAPPAPPPMAAPTTGPAPAPPSQLAAPTTAPAPAPPSQLAAPTAAPSTGALTGRLVFAPDSDRDFWVWPFPSAGADRLTHFTRLDFASFPMWSPDGQQIAFSYYQLPRVGAIPAGTDLFVMNADGTDLRPVARHDTQGAALLYPAWSPDGTSVYVTHQARAPNGGADVRIDKVDVRSGDTLTVRANAAYPGPSRDGRLLAFVNVPDPDGRNQSLWITGTNDGSTAARQLIPPGVFVRFSSLRFAPDGQRLLFAAVGQGTTFAPPAGTLPDLALGLISRRLAPVARADGEEWDLWTIDPDGRELRRLTNIAEDLPVASWSPDGAYIAFLGGGSARTAETGLVLIGSDGSGLRRLTSLPGHRGADWSALP